MLRIAFYGTIHSNFFWGYMWDQNFAITEADADRAGRCGTVSAVKVVKSGADEFHVILSLSWATGEFFLCTTRNKKEPRKFRHIGRLLEYIEGRFPGINELRLVLR